MSVSTASSALSRWAAFGTLSSALADGVLGVEAAGLWGSSRGLVLAALLHEAGRPIVSIGTSAAERHQAALDLEFFLAALGAPAGRDGGGRVLEFPSGEPAS